MYIRGLNSKWHLKYILHEFWSLLVKSIFQQFFVSPYRKKKEDNSPKDTVFPLSPKDTPWEMKEDTTLQGLAKEVEESILSLDDEREKFAALARSELIRSTSVDADQYPLLYFWKLMQTFSGYNHFCVWLLVSGWSVKSWVEKYKWRSCMNSHGGCTSANWKWSSSQTLFQLVWSDLDFSVTELSSSRCNFSFCFIVFKPWSELYISNLHILTNLFYFSF